MKKLLQAIKWLYSTLGDTRGNITLDPPHIDKSLGVYITKQAGGRTMKKQEQLKLINITRNSDKATMQKKITEKLSKIITNEYNNT